MLLRFLRKKIEALLDIMLDRKVIPRTDSNSRVIVIGDKNFVFGLDWRIAPSNTELKRNLKKAKKDGFSHYTLTQYGDLVGYYSGYNKKKTYSAALVVSENLAKEGLTVVVLKLEDDLFGVVILEDSKPVPGYDFVGTKSEIDLLVGEFLKIQETHHIVKIGNSGYFPDELQVELDFAFHLDGRRAALKKLPNPQRVVAIISVITVVASPVYFTLDYLQKEKQQVELLRKQIANRPNTVYERKWVSAKHEIGIMGQVSVDNWLQTIQSIPVKNMGWILKVIECTQNECKASWKREYGNFDDFKKNILKGVIDKKTEEIQSGDDPAVSSIYTYFKLPNLKEIELDRQTLPDLKTGLISFSSYLQDLSLLDGAKSSLTKPEMYPVSLDARQIHLPVFRGKWSYRGLIYSLNEIKIPAYAVANSLVVKATDNGDFLYEVSGYYYVRAERQ
jgi:Pilin accessory protein (PilO)